jgi:PIN domain nuclease of toxin-antitoxin system
VTGPRAPKGVLLDTCAVIWLANRDKMLQAALDAIFHAGLHEGVFVSMISAWEIGMLGRRKSAGGLQFVPDPKSWFARFMAGPAIQVAPLTADIAISASDLPEPLHGDPADRLLIATARHLSFPIVTRDRKIADYSRLGHVDIIVC